MNRRFRHTRRTGGETKQVKPGPAFKPRLKPLTFDFQERLDAAFTAHDKTLWVYYFPFLYCYGRAPDRQLLYTQTGDSHVLFLERETDKGRQLDLFIPPVPLTREAVEFARAVIRMRRRPRPGRLLWVDEADAPKLREWGLEVLDKEQEYLIDPQRIVGPEAELPKRLRKKLKRAAEQPLRVVPFSHEHVEGSLELLEELAQAPEEGIPLLDYDYTVKCLEDSDKLMARGMIGLAALREDALAGFAFGGRMTPTVANFFILKTNPEIEGLAEWLRVEFLRRAADFKLVNDASDLGQPGLAQHKRQFLPVRMLPAFTVRNFAPPEPSGGSARETR